MIRRSAGLAVRLVALAALLLGGCAPSGGSAPASLTTSDIARASTLEAIQQSGKLRVGLEAGYLPFEMIDRSGQFLGFDVALAREMAKRLGVELVIVNTRWDGIIPSLNTNKFDIIMSGMTRTLERAKAVNFSVPYYETGQTLLLHRQRAGDIEDPFELNQPGRVLAVKLGTTGDLAATKLFPKADIRRFQTEAEAALEVQSGKADALVYDAPFVAIYARQHPEHVVALLKPFTRETLAFALRKGDFDFLAWVNLFIEEIKNDDPVESTYDRLVREYFVDMTWLGASEEPAGS